MFLASCELVLPDGKFKEHLQEPPRFGGEQKPSIESWALGRDGSKSEGTSPTLQCPSGPSRRHLRFRRCTSRALQGPSLLSEEDDTAPGKTMKSSTKYGVFIQVSMIHWTDELWAIYGVVTTN